MDICAKHPKKHKNQKTCLKGLIFGNLYAIIVTYLDRVTIAGQQECARIKSEF